MEFLIKNYSDNYKHMKSNKSNKNLKFLIESKSFYKIDDIVLIEYWYNDMICPVRIVDYVGKKYKVTHNIEQSKIQNAPDELISSSEIIDHAR